MVNENKGPVKIIISGGDFPLSLKKLLPSNIVVDKVDLGITLTGKYDEDTIVSYKETELERILSNNTEAQELIRDLDLKEEIKNIEDFNEFKPREKFYKIMELLGPGSVKTSAPSLGDFLKSLEDADKYDKILIVPISKELSGTYNNASLAVEELKQNHENGSSFKEKISLVDPGFATYLLGIYAYNLVVNKFESSMTEFRSPNKSEQKSRHENLYFGALIYDAKYIEKGGRAAHILIRYASNVLDFLDLKLWIALQDGKVNLVKKFGNEKSFNKKLLEKVEQFRQDNTYKTGVFLAYTGRDMKNEFSKLENILKGMNIPYELRVLDLTVGTHLGPRAIVAGVYKF